MNPVLLKDLLALLRLKRVAALQVFFVAALALMVIVTWPQAGVLSGQIQASGQMVRGDDPLLLGLIVGQIVLLVLLVPGVAATALTGEKEANTLEMLYASRLSPAQIVVGKVVVAIIYPLLLLLSAVPFLALLNYRGDVVAEELIWSYALLVAAAIFIAMVSLAVSAVCRSSATALVVAYVLVLALTGGLIVPAAIMLQNQSGLPADVLHYARAASPVAAVLSLLQPHQQFGATDGRLPLWQAFLAVAALATAASAFIIVARLRRPPAESEGFGRGTAEQELSTMRRMLYLIDPNKRPRPFGAVNAVASKERRTNLLRSGRWMIRIFYGSLFLSLILAAMSIYGGETQHTDLLRYVTQVIICFQVGIIALVAPSLTSSTVSSEVESGTFETLRLTRLSGRQIFLGKFVPALFPALLPILAIVPAYAVVCYIEIKYIADLVWVLPVMALATAFCCTVGLACSTFIGNTARATVSAYLITAAVFVLPALAWFAAGRRMPDETAARLAFLSPLVMSLNVLRDSWTAVLPFYNRFLWSMGGLCVLMLVLSWARLSYLLRRGVN